MAGHHPWQNLIDKMPPDRREAFEAAAKEQRIGRLIAQIRLHSGLTQKELAERLGIQQPNLSKIEAAEDMRLDTLKRIITELGGEVVIHMPGGDIPLTGAAEAIWPLP